MPLTLWIIAVLLWIAWGAQAVLSAMLVAKFARRYRKPTREPFEHYRPPAVVIVPFKGAEPAIAEHLDALCTQDYPDYRVLLVVESADDPAYPLLVAAQQRHPARQVEVLQAGQAGPNEGQKVHNHLAAIAHLEASGGREVVWAFADSDAVPGPAWLGKLVGPLLQPNVTAVTTGYRWLTPQADETGRVRFASHVASIINASAIGFLGREEQNHAWGGSMAIPVETARELGLKDWLRGALSDDYQVTRMAKASGKRIYFVPQCLVASPVSFTWRSLMEFARRQYLITRTHAPGIYYGGLFLQAFYQLGLWSAWAAIAWMLATRPAWWREPWFYLPVAALLCVAVANQCRAVCRRHTIRGAFGPEMEHALTTTLRIDRWLTPVWMTCNFLLLLSAAVGRTITWRGNTYRIHAPQRIEKVGGEVE